MNGRVGGDAVSQDIVREWRSARWGPAHLVDRRFSTSVRIGSGAEVTIDGRDPRLPSQRDAEPELTVVNLGMPVLVDGVRVATVIGSPKEIPRLLKPGRFRVEGDEPFVTPGMILRGHVLPQRLTLQDAQGPLVWTPPLRGLANLHSIPLLLTPARSADRAQPEHVALWLAVWWKLTAY